MIMEPIWQKTIPILTTVIQPSSLASEDLVDLTFSCSTNRAFPKVSTNKAKLHY